MITKELLEKIGFEYDDIDFILEQDKKYGERIRPIADEYLAHITLTPLVHYEDGEVMDGYERGNNFIQKVCDEISEENPHILRLVTWLNCAETLHKRYIELGLDEDIFYEGMKDFYYKFNECKRVYDVRGVFTNWFFLFFDLRMFALGRLQYHMARFECDEYILGDLKLKKGDPVYACHIPSSGKLTVDMCLDSFQKAYEFFGPRLSGNIIPIVCNTWLFYKPYVNEIYPPDSNLRRFAELFDIIRSDSRGNEFSDGWRVFDKMYEGTTEGLPADTTLRRNFINYINDGGDFGAGYGVLFYDGKEKKLVRA